MAPWVSPQYRVCWEPQQKDEGGNMSIKYVEPLARGFGRMKKALFQPFDMKKWFVVGFTAFLAGLTDCNGHGGSGGRGDGGFGWEHFFSFPQRAWDWLLDNPGWFTLIIFGVFLLFILIVVLTWLSSRGKFMFLDNVVHDGSRVSLPWREYRVEGNSLFLWRFVFGFIVTAVILFYVIVSFSTLYGVYETAERESALIMPLVLLVLGLIALFLLAAYIHLLLKDFVVPIMYKYRITAMNGWRRFLPLFSRHLFQFIGYGLLVFFLVILVVIGIVVAGLLTCCLGFLLLVIPYINAVVLLPITYTFRSFSVEFLEQFGPEYYLFPRNEAGVTNTEAASS
jgi:hypothetical protein